jgi:peptidoglycan/xylan/chitin deacetylase (PgdA/CDA1 family)
MALSIVKKVNSLVENHIYWFSGAITHVYTHKPIVALTFDDGPDRVYTTELLDVLDRYDAKATFFVAGERIEKHVDILGRMNRSGHCIGNHSWDHPSFPLQSGRERRNQIRRGRMALRIFDSRLFRPPFGHLDLKTCFDIHLYGYRIIGWSVDAEDWLNHSADVIYGKLSAQIKPGKIVLLHDNLFFNEKEEFLDRSPTIAAVDMLLSKLKSFQFVTVLQLLKIGRPVYRPWRMDIDQEWVHSLVRSSG